jgi:hypothetical protein
VTRRREEQYIQSSFEQHARAAGWMVFHAFDARRSVRGRVTADQARWIAELDMVPGITAFVARCPRDWARITEALR